MSDQILLDQASTQLGFKAPTEADLSCAVTLLTDTQAEFSPANASIELSDGKPLVLQGLKELYTDRADVRETATFALCMTIEYALAKEDHQGGHNLQDAAAIEVLEKLSMKPEPELQGLGAVLQAWLRLELSLQDYSRSEVRQAIRRCLRSAQRHQKEGPRAYLGFIHHFIH